MTSEKVFQGLFWNQRKKRECKSYQLTDGSSEKVEKVNVKHICFLSLSLDSCPNEWRSSCTRLRTPIFIGIRWKNQISKKCKQNEENLLLRTPKAHKQGIEAALNMDMLMHCFFKTNTLLVGFAKKWCWTPVGIGICLDPHSTLTNPSNTSQGQHSYRVFLDALACLDFKL